MRVQSAQFLPKVTPPLLLPGSLHARWGRCGTTGCRCAKGELHGPYYRRFWREGGRTRSAYIRRADVPGVLAACVRYKAARMSRRAMRRMLRDHDALLDQVLAAVTALRTGDLAGQARFIQLWEGR